MAVDSWCREWRFAVTSNFSIELVVMSDFNAVPFASLTPNQAADMIRVAAQRPSDRSAASKSTVYLLTVSQGMAPEPQPQC